MTNETLEEIFWKDGKFVNSKNNEIKPEAVGEPFQALISYPIRNLEETKRVIDLNVNHLGYKNIEFNAFLKNNYPRELREELEDEKHPFSAFTHVVQLYKI